MIRYFVKSRLFWITRLHSLIMGKNIRIKPGRQVIKQYTKVYKDYIYCFLKVQKRTIVLWK